jgi:colanic acid biosynthesis glycosyl transferase WcaI
LVFSPDGVSTAQLMSELAADLKAQGHEITVLTATPHYNVESDARARQPLRPRIAGLLYMSEYEGIPVYHARVPSKSGRLGGRVTGYAVFHAISTVAGLALGNRFDIILAPSPPLTIGLSASILSRWWRIPFIFNVQEIYPDIAVHLRLLRNRSVIRTMELVERFVYERASAVVVISEWFRRILLEKGVPGGKLHVIPNFVDVDFMRPEPRDNDFARRHGLQDRFVVLYAGNIGLTQGFETLLDAATALSDLDDVRLVIVGDGVLQAWLRSEIASRGLRNVMLLTYQPRSLVPQIYAASDLCLVPLKRGAAWGTFPSKIYTIMAAGRPALVVADSDSEAAWLVQNTGCGFLVPPEDPLALAGAIRNAYRDRASLSRLGESGRRYVVAHHSRAVVAQQYHHLIQQLVGRSGVEPLSAAP